MSADVGVDAAPIDAGSDAAPTDASEGRDGGAYLPTRVWPIAVHDGYVVRDRGRGIEFPIKVRHPRGATGPLPLVVLSHGGLANPRGHESLEGWGEAFARSGYVAIHIAHVGADAITAMCTALRVPTSECELEDYMREVSAGGSLPPPIYFRPFDARAVLDDLPGIEAAVNVRIDRERMGLGGHSGGTQSPMRAAGAVIDVSPSARAVRDPEARFRAFFAASPQGAGRLGFGADSWAMIRAPMLILTRSADATSGVAHEQRRLPLDRRRRDAVDAVRATTLAAGSAARLHTRPPRTSRASPRSGTAWRARGGGGSSRSRSAW